MNKVELLDSLYDVRDVLSHLVIYTTPGSAGPHVLEELLQRREQISLEIGRVIQADLKASADQLTQACKDLDAETAQLKKLEATVEDAEKAIGIVAQIVSVIEKVIAAVAAA